MIIHMANNKAIVGPNVNSRLSNFLGYTTLIIMTAAILTLFITEFSVEKIKALISTLI